MWLTCTYDLDGGTLGQLRWQDKDNVNVATATPTSDYPCYTSAPENYRIDCNLASYEVRLGILNPVHGDTYSCSVSLSDFTLIGPVPTLVYAVDRRKIIRKRTSKDRDHVTNQGVSLSRPGGEQHGNPNKGTHFDDTNLEEQEQTPSYENFGSNAAAYINVQVSTDDRQTYESLDTGTSTTMYENFKDYRNVQVSTGDRQTYESLGTGTNTTMYENFKGPAGNAYENTA
ncbi:uncharacterized protein LOC117320060 [Pecten maximus]|uniref:uncharacterized protein LOC117320060 n=1 Tax=Pecten maximus TaxID=6579 RepID=UPI001458DFB7|nr:uncharacterized protein LOC117320060 [Pecten maximus]